jgi:hypothetical protein
MTLFSGIFQVYNLVYVNFWPTGIGILWIISEIISVNNCWKKDLCHAQSRCPNRLFQNYSLLTRHLWSGWKMSFNDSNQSLCKLPTSTAYHTFYVSTLQTYCPFSLCSSHYFIWTCIAMWFFKCSMWNWLSLKKWQYDFVCCTLSIENVLKSFETTAFLLWQ